MLGVAWLHTCCISLWPGFDGRWVTGHCCCCCWIVAGLRVVGLQSDSGDLPGCANACSPLRKSLCPLVAGLACPEPLPTSLKQKSSEHTSTGDFHALSQNVLYYFLHLKPLDDRRATPHDFCSGPAAALEMIIECLHSLQQRAGEQRGAAVNEPCINPGAALRAPADCVFVLFIHCTTVDTMFIRWLRSSGKPQIE